MRSEEKIESLRRALGWLRTHARDILAFHPNWLKLAKRIAELAMLASDILDGDLLAREPELAREARDWLDAAWRVTRAGDFFAEAVATDPTWTALAMTYAPFRRHGYRHPRLEQLLAIRAADSAPDWFVALATACAYRELEIPTHHVVETLAREAWCLRIPEYQVSDVGRMYETTHAILWLERLGAIPAEARGRLQHFVPRWIAHYRTVHNPDLVAELVLAAHWLGLCADDATWQWLGELQTSDGSLREMDIPTPVLGRFHVTTVFAMAQAACVGRCGISS